MFSKKASRRSKSTLTVLVVLVVVLWSSFRPVGISTQVEAVAPNVTLREWPIPSSSAGPYGIGVDQLGKVWFTENLTNNLAMLDPTINKFYEWSIPSGGDPRQIFLKQISISGVTSTRVYFTQFGSNRVGYFDNSTTTVNTFTQWSLSAGSNPVGIYVDDNNEIWFTETGKDTIARLSPLTNQLTEWKLPGATAAPGSPLLKPWGIYVQTVPTGTGFNRFAWFTLMQTDKIGRLEATSGRLTLFDLSTLIPGTRYQPMDITLSTEGMIFSNINSNRISILGNATTTVRDFVIPTGASKPTSLKVFQGSIWFAGNNAGNVGFANSTFSTASTLVGSPTCTIPPGTGTPQCTGGSTTTATLLSSPSVNTASPTVNSQSPAADATLSILNSLNGVTEYGPLPTTASRPLGLAISINGDIWITESATSVNKIGRIQVPFTFQVSASPSSRTINQGESTTFTVTITYVGGTKVPVSLSVNTPSSMTANFNPLSGTPPFTSTLTIGTTSATPSGTYPLTVTGSGGGSSANAGITLIVQQVTTTTTTTPGFDFALSILGATAATITQGDSASFSVLVSAVSGPSQPVSLTASGLPEGATYTLTTTSGTPDFNPILTIATTVDTPDGSHTITITGTGGTATHSTTVTLTINPLPRDFTISASVDSVRLTQGSRSDVVLTIGSVGVFSAPVTLSYTLSPSEPTLLIGFSSSPVTPTAGGTITVTLDVIAQRNTPAQTYQLTISAASGSFGPKEIVIQVSVSGCFIATATFGSELAPEVQLLRNFRDHQIMYTFAGSNFMRVFNAWYYSYSPSIANLVATHDPARAVMKVLLYPLIGVLRVSSVTFALLAFEPELAALATGIVASFLIGLTYFALPLSGMLILAQGKTGRSRGRAHAKWLARILAVLIAGFLISELAYLPAAMMIVSAGIVLTALSFGALLPAFAVVELARRKRQQL